MFWIDAAPGRIRHHQTGRRPDVWIDEGGDFFSLRVQPPRSGMAARVGGKRTGDTFELAKMGTNAEIWTVSEMKSKYLHLQHRVMEEYEVRFPDGRGSPGFTVGQDNIDSVLDIVRRRAEQNTRNVAVYTEQQLPLGSLHGS